MSRRVRKISERRGRQAENFAVFWLMLKGYTIYERRHQTPFGEIDIIAKKKRILAVVEVKYRPHMQAAHDSLRTENIRRVAEAANYYQGHNAKIQDLDIRFDAFFVFPNFRFSHLKDAWRTY